MPLRMYFSGKKLSPTFPKAEEDVLLRSRPDLHLSPSNFRVDSSAVAMFFFALCDIIPGNKEHVELVLKKFAVSF